MPQVVTAILQPASGGFGEWDWVEAFPVQGAETIEDYEGLLADLGLKGERTDELAGRIHNEYGVVYRFDESYQAGGERIQDWKYEMVWVESEPAQIVSTATAAREKGVSTAAIRRAIAEGRIAAVKVGQAWLIRRKDLARYVVTGKPSGAR